MDVDVEGPLGDLHELAEQAVDCVPAAGVILDLIPASDVEQHIVGEQVVEGGEGSVGVLRRATFGCSDMVSPAVALGKAGNTLFQPRGRPPAGSNIRRQ